MIMADKNAERFREYNSLKHEYAGEITDSLTYEDYYNAGKVMAGRSYDLVPDEEERHYAMLTVTSMLGLWNDEESQDSQELSSSETAAEAEGDSGDEELGEDEEGRSHSVPLLDNELLDGEDSA